MDKKPEEQETPEAESVEEPLEAQLPTDEPQVVLDAPEDAGADQAPVEDGEPEAEAPEDDRTEGDGSEADTFPRPYVEKLRKEAAASRARARDRDALAERLHFAQVEATGRLADPQDLPYSEDLLDPEALEQAIDNLLAAKPHLATRVPRGSIGQGAAPAGDGFSLAGFLRNGA